MSSKIYNINKIENFLSFYPSIGKIKKIEFMTHNNINSTNFMISTLKGKYVLRNFTASAPEFEMALIILSASSRFSYVALGGLDPSRVRPLQTLHFLADIGGTNS